MSKSDPEFPDYSKSWDKVQQFENRQQFQSALKEVRHIAEMAASDGNHPQLVKTFVYQARFTQYLEEDGWVKVFELAESEIAHAENPEKTLYYAITAELYHSYLNQNQWRISQIDVVEPTPSDFREWSVDDFRDRIESYYLHSLNFDVLNSEESEDYKAILTESKRAENLRPTLSSILMDKALNYFAGAANLSRHQGRIDKAWVQPSDTFFEVSSEGEEDYFEKFTHHFKTFLKDQYSEKNVQAAVDFDLRRLSLGLQETGLDEEYLQSLDVLMDNVRNKDARAEILYAKANFVHNQTDDNGKRPYVLAKSICEQVIDQYPKTYGADQCRALLQNSINQHTLSFSYETINLPNVDSRLLVQYRNIASVEIEYARVDAGTEFYNRLKPRHDQLNLKSLDWQKVGTFDLPGFQDMNQHSVELGLPELPAGEYVVRISGQSSTSKAEVSSSGYIYISNLAFFTTQNKENTRGYVTNRLNGTPLPNVEYYLYRYLYNQEKRKNEYDLVSSGMTDGEGSFEVDQDREQRGLMVRIKQNEDDLYITDGQLYRNSMSRDPKSRSEAVIFTDRSIYKPGQVVHFKGVLLLNSGKKKSLQPHQSVNVKLMDVNRQSIEELDLKSNEWGSVVGTFRLPRHVLPGRWTIVFETDSRSQTAISVENYQRPQIEAEFAQSSKNYALGDSVELKLNAGTYYGVPLQNAAVRYVVKRRTIIPFFARGGYYARCYFPWPNQEEIIARGSTSTNNSGEALISFYAVDNGNEKYGIRPWQTFVVQAEVVDETGEPTTAEKTLTLSQSRYQVSLTGQSPIDVASGELPTLEIKNFDHQPIAIDEAELTISIMTPGDAAGLRNRYWSVPDEFYYDSLTFRERFPYDPFKEEDLVVNYQSKDLKSLSLQGASTYNLKQISIDWHPGIYMVSVQRDGQEIFKEFITVYDKNKSDWPGGTENFHVAKEEVELGENKIDVFNTFESIPYLALSHGGEPEWMSGHRQPYQFQLKNEDRDNAGFLLVQVQKGRFHTLDKRLKFPSKKELNLIIEDIPEVALPGSEQTWTIKVSDDDGNPVEAEVAISVFDQALDVYQPHSWSSGQLFQIYKPYKLSVNGLGFGIQHAHLERRDRSHFNYEHRQYPQLISFYPQRGYYPQPRMLERNMVEEEVMMSADASDAGGLSGKAEQAEADGQKVEVRKDLAELAYWNGVVVTDKDGKASVSFKMKEDLTRWKILGVAHDTGVRAGHSVYEMVTKKDVLIQPYTPELLRAGDEVELTAKVSNSTEEDIQVRAELQLHEALTMNSLDSWIDGDGSVVLNLPSNGSKVVRWMVKVPQDAKDILEYKMILTGNGASDGQQGFISIENNREHVNEAKPFFLNPGETREISIDEIEFYIPQATTSKKSFDLEVVSGPEWYALQNIPFLAEAENESLSSLLRAVYVNSTGLHLIQSNPWMKKEIRNLSKKSPLLQKKRFQQIKSELSPWQRAALEETDHLSRITYFLKEDSISQVLMDLMNKIAERQLVNGGFSWMPGGKDNWYMSEHVYSVHIDLYRTTGQRLLSTEKEEKLREYNLDRLSEYLKELKKNRTNFSGYHPGSLVLMHLLGRSRQIADGRLDGFNSDETFFYNAAVKHWADYGLHDQVMVAQIMHNVGDQEAELAEMIISFKERMIKADDRGNYWKHDQWRTWSDNYLVTHSRLIQFFHDRSEDELIPALMTYLIQHKRTNRWGSPNAALEAVKALLINNWDERGQLPLEVRLNGELLSFDYGDDPKLYASKSLSSNAYPGQKAIITVTNPNDKVAWGALHWSYEENMDQMEAFESNELKIAAATYGRSDEGKPLVETETFRIGQKVVTQIVVELDREMQFVVVDAGRAAGLHPGLELSGYEYQAGLRYYKAIQSQKTQFFIDYLPRGKHVLQYGMTANHKGDFSHGLMEIQSMYAPEFGSHTEGQRIEVLSNK